MGLVADTQRTFRKPRRGGKPWTEPSRAEVGDSLERRSPPGPHESLRDAEVAVGYLPTFLKRRQGKRTAPFPVGSNGFLQGFRQLAGADTEVTFSVDGEGAQGADAVILFVGEAPCAEWHGDTADLALPQAQLDLARRVKQAGTPLVVVVVSGRPVILGPLEPMADAIVAAWLPGTEGAGLAEVLTGAYDFTGRLPRSWARNMSQLPLNVGDADHDPLYAYGFGLSYGRASTE